MREPAGHLVLQNQALPRMTTMRCYVSWESTDARAVGPANRLHRDGEEQHQLSGLAPSLWENLPYVYYFVNGTAMDESDDMFRLLGKHRC